MIMHHHRSPILTIETNITSETNVRSETSQEKLGYLGIVLKKLQETKVENDEGIIFLRKSIFTHIDTTR